jgi:hypothetical protein
MVKLDSFPLGVQFTVFPSKCTAVPWSVADVKQVRTFSTMVALPEHWTWFEDMQ